ncbi:protoporphyrinogen oxidase HemJ [Emticicia sp. SJ17W-69]|uniref:protoporphyrinogen oxidase HemJ n=1 Tax=Emticicia sp. SJ17W-69 TaxID=3421657 RepID=UPI003EBBB57A
MLHLYLKSLHIIGFVSWFAGLFYLVRMFVYHAESADKPESIREDWKKQYTAMQWRVYKIICNPAMMITWTCGILMLVNTPAFLEQGWMQVKLVFLVLLTTYHLYCKGIISKQESGKTTFTSFQFRLLNELPTLFLVTIVLLAVVKDLLNFIYLFLGVIAFGVTLFFSARAYRKYREGRTS